MLSDGARLALFMEGALGDGTGKMGYGVLRYSPHEVVCVIDSNHAGKNVQDVVKTPRSAPVVGTVEEAKAMGADVMILGIAPPGGLIPEPWYPLLDRAVDVGFSLVNGLHDLLGPRYPDLGSGQFVWDIRLEPKGIGNGTGAARLMENRRVLLVGSDMAVGKMTAGLELQKSAIESGIKADFVATGQIGILITGKGVPLDAVRVDFASGAIEREVVACDGEMVIIEGQGSLIHPGSTSPLPLMRGSMPTHLILCHRAGMKNLPRVPWVEVPEIMRLVKLNEDLAEAGGVFPRPQTAAIALNTGHIDSDEEAREAVDKLAQETGLTVCDPIRDGASLLVEAVMSD